MSKRKTGALRAQQRDSRYTMSSNDSKTYYVKESKTINFNQSSEKTGRTNRKSVELVPKTMNQEKFILQLLNDQTDIIVTSGPAGTGKTYLAVTAAIKALKNKQCERIILTRPAVTVEGEEHGFLPGDLNQKMEPWVKPIINVFREYYSVEEIARMLDEQIIEIIPLAFCRGLSFKNSWVIADEMQNSSIAQSKMLLTRIGENSKMIFTGDIEQADRKIKDNGLLDLQQKLSKHKVNGIETCEFDVKDVQRHRLIGEILNLYK